ncbi:MAG TPA: gliding motility-associated protein GldE, partial [Flavitalea sp.]|nr:gliding motility-associated protein GldE [Flavitalea sp.]
MENQLLLTFFCDSFHPLFLAANTQATVLLALTMIILLILSFFISGAEVAFFSLTYRDINLLKTKQDPGWKRIANLLEEPKLLAATLQISNTFVNIAIIILANVLIDQIRIAEADTWWMTLTVIGIKVIVITSVLVLFGETLPKVRASQNNLRFAYEASYLVEVLYYLFKRTGARLISMSDYIERFLGGKASRAYSQQQLEAAIKSTVQEEDEQRILTGIYKFGDITVKQVMRTRLDVSGIEHTISFGELKKKIDELHYSRLPIYKGSLDDIVGMVHSKDLLPHLHEPDDFDWSALIRPPYFVHEQKYIKDLLKEFQHKRIHFAVVVDEFGGTSGIVTLEDILEEIIGDIKDEFDDEESANKKLDDNTYIFEGGTMINDVCKTMGLPFDTFNSLKGESDSLAGLALEVAGEIPKAGDAVKAGDFEFTIVEVDRNRIKKVKV